MSQAASDVVIVDSSLTVEFLNQQNLDSVPSKTIRLSNFANAYWQLHIRCKKSSSASNTFYFHIAFVNFPEELKKNCFTEFSVSFKNDVEPKLNRKKPFQTTYRSGSIVVDSTVTSFTANLLITKKTPSEYPHKSLLDDISGMYKEKAYSDFTFIVKGKKFNVHKFILAASSATMHTLFTADYKEKDTNECKIVDIDPGVFEALISFMYCRTVPKNFADIAQELYKAAHYYEVEALKNICLDEIQKNLSPCNAMESYMLALNYDLEKLTEDSWTIIKCNILEIKDSNLKPMPPHEIAEILSLRQRKKNETLKLQKTVEALLQTEQSILKKYA